MNRIIFQILILTFSVLFLNSCKTTQLQVQKPSEIITQNQSEKILSNLNLPISINLKNIEKEINTQFQKTLYDDQSFDNNSKDNLIIKIDKRNQIVITTLNNQLQINAPLSVSLKYRFEKTFLGVDLSHIQDANFNVVITTLSKIEISKDWKLKITTEPSLKWEDSPGKSLGIVLNKTIDYIVKQRVDDISNLIENAIIEAFDIKSLVAENWKLVQKPFEIDEILKAWLYIQPQDISLSPFVFANNKLEFKAGLNSFIDVKVGEKKEETKPNNLPQLKVQKDFKNDASINLTFELKYSEINKLVNKVFKDSTFVFDNGKSKITVKNIDIFGSENNLVLGFDIIGKVKKGVLTKKINGIVYLTGQPFYNSLNQSIEIKNFDFDLKSRDVLLKSASWIVNNKKFRADIEKQLIFPINTELKEAQKLANAAINQNFTDKIKLSGKILNIEPKEVFIKNDAIKIIINANANLNMNVDGY
jgi:hypothetical protein